MKPLKVTGSQGNESLRTGAYMTRRLARLDWPSYDAVGSELLRSENRALYEHESQCRPCVGGTAVSTLHGVARLKPVRIAAGILLQKLTRSTRVRLRAAWSASERPSST